MSLPSLLLYSQGKAQLESELEENLASALSSLADQTEGMSSREVEKLVTSFQGACFSSEDFRLTRAMWDQVVARKIQERNDKSLVMSGDDSLCPFPFLQSPSDPPMTYAEVHLRPAASLSLDTGDSTTDAIPLKKAAGPGKPAAGRNPKLPPSLSEGEIEGNNQIPASE